MLLAVTYLFITLRLPDVIMFQVSLGHMDPELKIKVESWLAFFMLLTIVNHSVNFFIYLIFLESFRNTFLTMFLPLCCFCQRKQKRETVKNTGQSDDLGVQKAIDTNIEKALKVFTVETEN